MLMYAPFLRGGDLVPLLFARHGPDLTDCSDLIVHGWPGFLDWFEGPRRSFGRWLDARHGSLTLRELDPEGLAPEPILQASMPPPCLIHASCMPDL